jgi:hypothetical protein
MIGILFHGTKIEANSPEFHPNHSEEEKTTRNFLPWNKNRIKLFGIPFQNLTQARNQLRIPFHGIKRSKLLEFRSDHSTKEETTRNSISKNKNKSKLSEFRSKSFRRRENNSEFLSVEQK